nr:hypothetical protein 27 [bacterium]
MDKSYTFTFTSDPSHGYLSVPQHLIKELGLQDSISECSFIDRYRVYLEEDCDAITFLRAVKRAKISYKVKENSINRKATCRSFARYDKKFLCRRLILGTVVRMVDEVRATIVKITTASFVIETESGQYKFTKYNPYKYIQEVLVEPEEAQTP